AVIADCRTRVCPGSWEPSLRSFALQLAISIPAHSTKPGPSEKRINRYAWEVYRAAVRARWIGRVVASTADEAIRGGGRRVHGFIPQASRMWRLAHRALT